MKRGDLQTLHPMCEETNYKDPKIPDVFMTLGAINCIQQCITTGPTYVTPQIRTSEGLYNFQRNVAILTPLLTFAQYTGK
jgi:hypothetical protein